MTPRDIWKIEGQRYVGDISNHHVVGGPAQLKCLVPPDESSPDVGGIESAVRENARRIPLTGGVRLGLSSAGSERPSIASVSRITPMVINRVQDREFHQHIQTPNASTKPGMRSLCRRPVRRRGKLEPEFTPEMEVAALKPLSCRGCGRSGFTPTVWPTFRPMISTTRKLRFLRPRFPLDATENRKSIFITMPIYLASLQQCK